MGLAFLITTDRLQLLSERKVLKEAEYAALLDASAVVDTARREAVRIVERGTDEAREARRAGHAEGLREAQAEHAAQLIGEALATQRQLHALRRSMAQIIVKAVEGFMDDADPSTLFESALRRVDGLVRGEPFITVVVAPEDEAAMRDALERLGPGVDWLPRVACATDNTLRRGACVVSTASGTLEIGVDAQLEAFRKAVERDGLPVAVAHG